MPYIYGGSTAVEAIFLAALLTRHDRSNSYILLKIVRGGTQKSCSTYMTNREQPF